MNECDRCECSPCDCDEFEHTDHSELIDFDDPSDDLPPEDESP